MSISIRLKELRTEKKLTQKDLAAYLGLSSNSICEWEKGRCEPSIVHLAKLSTLFECSIDYLLGREDDFGNITIKKENAPTDNLSAEEKELLENFRQLNLKNKMHVSSYARIRLEEQDEFSNKRKA